MLNQTLLVGKIQDILLNRGSVMFTIIADGEKIPIQIGEALENVVASLSIGQSIGVKAKLELKDYKVQVVAQKLTYINIEKDDENGTIS